MGGNGGGGGDGEAKRSQHSQAYNTRHQAPTPTTYRVDGCRRKLELLEQAADQMSGEL